MAATEDEGFGYLVSFGNGSSVSFPTRAGADAMLRFLQRRRVEAVVEPRHPVRAASTASGRTCGPVAPRVENVTP
jgi:hypothetical protein